MNIFSKNKHIYPILRAKGIYNEYDAMFKINTYIQNATTSLQLQHRYTLQFLWQNLCKSVKMSMLVVGLLFTSLTISRKQCIALRSLKLLIVPLSEIDDLIRTCNKNRENQIVVKFGLW